MSLYGRGDHRLKHLLPVPTVPKGFSGRLCRTISSASRRYYLSILKTYRDSEPLFLVSIPHCMKVKPLTRESPCFPPRDSFKSKEAPHGPLLCAFSRRALNNLS